MATNAVKEDNVQVETNFAAGMVRDVGRGLIPEGGCYDAVDFMLEQPGRVYKRGGWLYHSALLPGPPSCVFTIHIPTRVGAIANGDLYDVTSENTPQAELRGTIGFSPAENPPTFYTQGSAPATTVDAIILCDPACANRPKKVYPVDPDGALTILSLPTTAPFARHSAVYASRLVLGNGGLTASVAGDPVEFPNRLWFSSLPGDIGPTGGSPGSDWFTDSMYLDTSYSITGLAAIQGSLLIFSPRFTERIIGGVPPGVEGENMELQPVGGVGCLDARSICVIDNQVIFGSQEGVFLTNGVAFDNLMEKSDRTGILSYWRDLFEPHEARSVVGGMLMRDYYMLSSRIFTSSGERRENFICYLPTRSWWRTANTHSNMFAIGATEQETVETYSALVHANYVARMTPMLKPAWDNRSDGNALPVQPSLQTRMFGSGPGLKAYGFGRITYDLRVPDSSTPTLAVSEAVGIEAESFVPCVESPLPKTAHADRARFSLFRDSQALALSFAQTGASESTEIFLVEVEHRAYNLPSDGE